MPSTAIEPISARSRPAAITAAAGGRSGETGRPGIAVVTMKERPRSRSSSSATTSGTEAPSRRSSPCTQASAAIDSPSSSANRRNST